MEAKRILLINGGMRKKGTSSSFARTFKILAEQSGSKADIVHILDFFDQKKPLDELIELISAHDIIAIFIPTYVNAPPYPVIDCMEQLVDRGAKFTGKSFFAVAQGGMHYLNVHQPVLDTCRHFAEEVKMNWRGGLICGMAPLINGAKLENFGFVGERITQSLKGALESLLLEEDIPVKAQKLLTVKIPTLLLYPLAAFLNFLTKQEFKKASVTDINPRPYLE